MPKKVKGKIQAVSVSKRGVKVNDNWYNFTDKLKGFFENSKGKLVELSIDDNGNVKYVKFIEESNVNYNKEILNALEEININILTLNNKLQNLIDMLYKIHSGKNINEFEGVSK